MKKEKETLMKFFDAMEEYKSISLSYFQGWISG